MRILVIGGTGTIGSAVVKALSARHEVIAVGHDKGTLRLDLASLESITGLFQAVGTCDAVAIAAGSAKFAPLSELTPDDYLAGVKNKLMGQVNVVRLAQPILTDGGSLTLTSGVLSQEPVKGSTALSMVNAGLEAFVRAAALELPRGLRINVVSPPWVKETLIARKMDPAIGLPADAVALAYVASIEGKMTGQTLDPRKLKS
jgi:NAD(P)-dependent dehydrogenase (short-subunit alcohol dehydrogenase family)